MEITSKKVCFHFAVCIISGNVTDECEFSLLADHRYMAGNLNVCLNENQSYNVELQNRFYA